MSFRKVGGVQYSATQNVIKSRYNVSDNLYVNKYVGEPNTVIDFLSDISGNINIYGDLDVSGNLNVSGDIDCSGNLYTDKDAYINSVRVGRGSGDYITNTVVGYTALNINTLGKSNTAVGYFALQNTDASFNTAVGCLAMNSNNTGKYNVAVGDSALQLSTAAMNCVAVGHGALTGSTTGNNNTAVGCVAMNSSTSGSNNVAIGSSSLQKNLGSDNTAVGYGSLFNNIIGGNNVGIGYNAGYDLSGNSNFNTFLGTNANVISSSNIYSNSTAIGYSAIIDASNQIVFGTSQEKIKIPGTYVGIGGVYNPGGSNNFNVDLSGNLQIVGVLPNNDNTKSQSSLRIVSKSAAATYSVLNSAIITLLEGYELGYAATRTVTPSANNPFMGMYPDALTGGNYNGLVKQGDHVMLWGNYPFGPDVTAGFVICPWQFSSNGLRMDASGNVGINKNNPQYALDVSGNGKFSKEVTATGYNISSDYRIKENAVKLDETFTVNNLRPVTYNNVKLNKQDIGLIAHELQEVYPFLVTGEKDGENLQSVNYNGLIGILIKEIQVLKERVKMLEQNPLFTMK